MRDGCDFSPSTSVKLSALIFFYFFILIDLDGGLVVTVYVLERLSCRESEMRLPVVVLVVIQMISWRYKEYWINRMEISSNQY